MIKLPPLDLYAGNTADRNSTNFPKRGNALAYIDTEADVFYAHVNGAWHALGAVGIPEPDDDAVTYGRKTDTGVSSWVAVVPAAGGQYTGGITISQGAGPSITHNYTATSAAVIQRWQDGGSTRWAMGMSNLATGRRFNIDRYDDSGSLLGTVMTIDRSNGFVGIGATPSSSHVINGGVVFNEPGADVDHRIETSGNANMFFVDGGNNRVGIGTNAPERTLHIIGDLIRVDRDGDSPGLLTRRLTTGLTTGDNISSNNAEGLSSAGAVRTYGALGITLESNTDGAEYAYYRYRTIRNGTLTDVMRVGGNGMQIGSPTGGFKGLGSLNVAADIYKNNSGYTNPDYVLEKHFTGQIAKHARAAKGYSGILPLYQLEDYLRNNWHLPNRPSTPMGIFDRADWVQEKLEEMALYICQLHNEIKEIKEIKNG